jgi:acyl-CoA synthetase (AMP-forming)/AMP-acid ligase II
MFATKIVKFNVEDDDVVRDPKTGLCIECDYDEVGELVAPIRTLDTANGKMENFEGYTNKEATEKKILRDVFAKGDQYFRSGDLLRRDAKGYFYFVDRIGDTFRWKGENVSTMDVSEVISSLPGVVDANVLGVQVQGKDGRAGVVVLTTEEGTEANADFRQQLATHCKKNLPPYSIPVFVRLCTEVNVTGTFKHQKVEYRNQGCDPSAISDEMWWYNAATSNYEPYGSEEYTRIIGGHSKL